MRVFPFSSSAEQRTLPLPSSPRQIFSPGLFSFCSETISLRFYRICSFVFPLSVDEFILSQGKADFNICTDFSRQKCPKCSCNHICVSIIDTQLLFSTPGHAAQQKTPKKADASVFMIRAKRAFAVSRVRPIGASPRIHLLNAHFGT